MKKRILQFIEAKVDFKAFKEDLRKIGINFITAGAVGLFITHFAQLTFGYIVATLWVILLGIIAAIGGLINWRK